MTADRPVLGISLMLGFCALAPLGDSIAKILGGVVPLFMLLSCGFQYRRCCCCHWSSVRPEHLPWTQGSCA